MQLPIENGRRFDEYQKLDDVGSGEDIVLVRMADGTGTKAVPLRAIVKFALEQVGVIGLDLKGKTLTGLPAPKQDEDAATKKYVDDVDIARKEQTDLDTEILRTTGAGFHNSVYRGKNLGEVVTTEQYAAIAAGTFDDLYIGDYWTIGGVNYRIAAFDYYLRCGDTECAKHHAVIVPDTGLYNAQMHNTPSGEYESGSANTTEGGYVGSDMYKTGLNQAKTTVKAAFPGHVLNHRVYLTNAVSNGRPSGSAWFDSEVELMNERMVYGNAPFSPASDGSSVPANHTVEKSQLPLFVFRPDLISNRLWYWLRDVASAANFALVNGNGLCYYGNASHRNAVRPAFSIF